MCNVDVCMLGAFTVIVNGINIAQEISGSKKSLELLQYFLINKDRSISANELFDVLWPYDENSNPESTLRTRISRFRSELAKYGLNKALATVKGFYRWNTEKNPTKLDVAELNELCIAIKKHESDDIEADCERVLEIYNGDLLVDYALTSWIAPKSMYYHNMYIDTIHYYLGLLEEQGRYSDICRVATRALESDQFDSELNLKLMDALLKTGKSKEAFARYNYTTSMHHTYLGVNPSDEILEFYKTLIATERVSEADIDTVCSELEGSDDETGAFLCEYVIFKDIFMIYRRNLKRLNTTMFLAMVTLNELDRNKNAKQDLLLLDKHMSSLCDVLKENLRMGDTVSRYSPSQFVILLPTLSWHNSQGVLHRIKEKFYERNPSGKYVVNIMLKPLEL